MPLDMIEEPYHPLLEVPSPHYSRSTVRRAMAVWLHCGQRNSFRAVCDYYHRLEALEDQLPEDRRALSRHPELDLFSSQPPTSTYLKQNYPRLYEQAPSTRNYQNYLQKLDALKYGQEFNCYMKVTSNQGNESTLNSQKNEKNEEEKDKGATKEEIVETSQMIGNFCKNSKIALKTFLSGFKEHALKCELKDTVLNVGFYIKRKMIHGEMMQSVESGEFPNFTKMSITSKSEESATVPNQDTEDNKAINKISDTYANATKTEEKDFDNSRTTSKVVETPVDVDLMINNKDIKLEGKVSNPIRLLKRENASTINGKTGFQNNLGKNETFKCRKI